MKLIFHKQQVLVHQAWPRKWTYLWLLSLIKLIQQSLQNMQLVFQVWDLLWPFCCSHFAQSLALFFFYGGLSSKLLLRWGLLLWRGDPWKLPHPFLFFCLFCLFLQSWVTSCIINRPKKAFCTNTQCHKDIYFVIVKHKFLMFTSLPNYKN